MARHHSGLSNLRMILRCENKRIKTCFYLSDGHMSIVWDKLNCRCRSLGQL